MKIQEEEKIMKTRGLGTGLSALFGDAAIEGEHAGFEFAPIQRVEPRPDQPRVIFESEKIDELTESIREHGILSPLTVRSVGDGYYQIIAGERRWRAARAAGLTEVPIRVIVADEKKVLEIALVENLQREDLNPIEEARGYKALMEEFEMTQEDVALRVSKSRPAIANALRLLSLPEEILEYVGKDEMSAGSARALLAIKDNDKMLEAANLAMKNSMSVREVESLVKKLGKKKAQDSNDENEAKAEVNYLNEAQNKLTETLGRRVVIKHGRNRGKIEIEYYGNEDFEALYEALRKFK